jgi:hypothetical protein
MFTHHPTQQLGERPDRFTGDAKQLPCRSVLDGVTLYRRQDLAVFLYRVHIALEHCGHPMGNNTGLTPCLCLIIGLRPMEKMRGWSATASGDVCWSLIDEKSSVKKRTGRLPPNRRPFSSVTAAGLNYYTSERSAKTTNQAEKSD